MNEQDEERILDLLCKQAVNGLTADESRELQSLEETVESPVDLHSLEMTAAAISMIGVQPDEKLPDHLKVGILAKADEYFSDQSKISHAVVPAAVAEKRTPGWAWLGWAAAGAFALLLIANIWISRPNSDQTAGLPSPSPAPEVKNPAQMRDQFMASAAASDMVKAEWGAGNMKDLAIAGDVVWSDTMQQGYMRFKNLPKNDKTQYTYQLWIFDETQDEKTPIDGGTFDVNEDGEIVVPIDAKLNARNAKAFAITMEKPGGVVVSKREKIPTLASVKPKTA